MLNRNFFFLLILVAGLVALFIYNKYRIAPAIDFFKLEVYDRNNIKKDLEFFRGKKIIVTYYASWCKDCLIELKILNEISNSKLKNVEIIAITDDPLEKLIGFQNKKKYSFNFFRINKNFSEMKINAIPVNYLVNTKGIVVWDKVGSPNWENDIFIKQALQLME